MEGGSVFGDCHDMISLFESTNNPLWVPSSSSSFHETMMNFNQEPQKAGRAISKRSRGDGSFARTSDGEDNGEDEFEINLCHQSEKKRRLSSEQVKFLEKSFEVENKLEPERKVELAKQLGLQPRQVAIWFQNRRARYKTKQIEKEFDSLKDNYERLKVDYETLNKEKENLQNEVEALTKKLAEKEEKEINSNLDTIQHFDEGTLEMGTHGKVDEDGSGVLAIPSTKQAEDASSAKSDVFDSESPPCTDANQNSALLIEASSALMRDLDQQSDFSQDEEEHLLMNNNLLLPQTPPIFNNFLKLAEDVNNYDPNAVSCNISLVDDQPFWSWLY